MKKFEVGDLVKLVFTDNVYGILLSRDLLRKDNNGRQGCWDVYIIASKKDKKRHILFDYDWSWEDMLEKIS